MPRRIAGPYTVKGVTYSTQYAYRKALAQSRGLPVTAYRATRSLERFLDNLGKRGNRTYNRTLEALNLMRKGMSAIEAAKRAGTTTKSIAKYGGGAVERLGRRLKVMEFDTLPRRMQFLMPDGVERNVIVSNSRDAETLGRYANALQKWMQGDKNALKSFEGRTVKVNGKRIELVTDPETLNTLTRAGVISDYEHYERSLS